MHGYGYKDIAKPKISMIQRRREYDYRNMCIFMLVIYIYRDYCQWATSSGKFHELVVKDSDPIILFKFTFKIVMSISLAF